MSILYRNWSENPVQQFVAWFEEAKRRKDIRLPEAVCLSTIDLQGFPDGRMVLLKQFDDRGFVFYTNLNSVKGKSLAIQPRAAMTFHWEKLRRQIRIQGSTEPISDSEADAYWKTRARLSQLG